MRFRFIDVAKKDFPVQRLPRPAPDQADTSATGEGASIATTTPDAVSVQPSSTALEAERVAFRPQYDQARAALGAARRAWLSKNDELKAATAAKDATLISKITTERATLRPQWLKAEADWKAAKAKWIDIEARIKALPERSTAAQ